MLGSGVFSPPPPPLVSKNFIVFITKFGPQLSDSNQVIMHNLKTNYGDWREGGGGRSWQFSSFINSNKVLGKFEKNIQGRYWNFDPLTLRNSILAFRKFYFYYLRECKVYEISVKYEEKIEIKDKIVCSKIFIFRITVLILYEISQIFIKILYYVDIQRLPKKSHG